MHSALIYDAYNSVVKSKFTEIFFTRSSDVSLIGYNDQHVKSALHRAITKIRVLSNAHMH